MYNTVRNGVHCMNAVELFEELLSPLPASKKNCHIIRFCIIEMKEIIWKSGEYTYGMKV